MSSNPLLLSILSKTICQYSCFFYFIFLFPSLFSHFLSYTSYPSSHLSDLITPLTRIIIGTLTGFSLSILLWNIIRIFVSTYYHQKIHDITRLNLLLSTISLITVLYISIFGWGGIKEDYYGVRIPWPLWIEWMTATPILVIIIVAFDTRSSLSSEDITLILHSELIVVAAFFLRLNLKVLPGILPTIFLLLFCYCCQTPFQLVLKTYQELKAIRINILHRNGNKEYLAHKLSLTSRRYDLSRILAIIFPIFITIYLLRAFRIINNEQCIVLFMIVNILSKMIYTEIASNAYLDEFHPANVQLLWLLQSDIERITYLKFVFHEARIPLQSISLGLEILNNSQHLAIPTDEFCDTIHHIKSSTKSISSIFDHILLLHKINDNKLNLNVKKNNLFLMINKIYTDHLPGVQIKHLDVKIQIDSNVPPEIICDLYYLSIVLSIYFENSLQFTPDYGKVYLYIFCSKGQYLPSSCGNNDEPWKGICFEVHDTGAKIHPNEMKSIFQPYFEQKVDDVRTHRGTGIGLSLCREIIRLHGGEVYCKSSHSGCIFGFIIPYTLSESHQNGISINSESITPNLSPLSSKIIFPLENLHILIVEDSPINRKMLQKILMNKHIKSDVAPNGVEAIESYVANPMKYSLIFMDNLMPKMDGVIASKKLRELGYDNLIIGLTGNVEEEDKNSFLQAGADLILSKPLRLKEFDALITFITHCGPKSLFKEMKIISSDQIDEWIPRD